jgi:hypothetical protein
MPTGKGKLAASISDSLEKRFRSVSRIGNFSGGTPCTFDELQEQIKGIDANIVVFMPHLPNIIVGRNQEKLRIEEGSTGKIEYCRAVKIVGEIKKIHPEILLVPFKIIEKDKGVGDVLRWMLNIHAALSVYSYLGESKVLHIVDALGNGITVSKENLPEALAQEIYRFSHAIRRRSVWMGPVVPVVPHLRAFVDFSRKMEPAFSNIIGNVVVGRWPGNFSFRCAQGFLSARSGNGFVVTKRNVAKSGLTEQDFVFVSLDLSGEKLQYWGDKNAKPSIDSPGHRLIYEELDWVEGIVHGHLHVIGDEECVYGGMLERWPCGAENEAKEILKVAPKTCQKIWIVNVAGHGFVALIGDQDPTEALDKLSGMSFDRKLGCELS